ncbi:MAG: adenosylmethionine--8-amino-7-oxononanoate transaminase [Chlamydiae bacterium]|nr:adenosylmethionine--8-amino-7-oxononanoate transaminase [Chlamydiota bacterium]MBI3265987.1 adenosylmethionine--8-amino-7-oxononanoate transaminase [Chlamydiota bacterium]
MTKNSKTLRLQELDKLYVWHPFTQMKDWVEDHPLIIESGDGVFLQDTDGKKYLDGVSSLWVTVHGHRKKALDRSLTRQLKKIAHSTLLGLANVPSIELAKELIQIAPKGLTKVFYSDNGSTAVEVALKMAYQYWQHIEPGSQRTKFISFREDYHGDTLGSVSVGGMDLFHRIFKPLLFDVIHFPSPYFFRNKDATNPLIQKMEEVMVQNKNRIIGVVMEPLIQAAAGMLLHPNGFLKAVRKLCDRHNILLIVDEVATGFGRTGKMFACEHEKVTPDLMAVAKGMTGGYLPLAATLVKEKIYNAFLGEYSQFKTFFHGHTYTGNPLACAVALESLRLFKKEKLLKKVQKNIVFLKKELVRFNRLSHVKEIRQCGMMVGIELEKFLLREKMGIKVCQQARKYGAILRPLGNVIVLMPPLAIQQKELQMLLEMTCQAIVDVIERD